MYCFDCLNNFPWARVGDVHSTPDRPVGAHGQTSPASGRSALLNVIVTHLPEGEAALGKGGACLVKHKAVRTILLLHLGHLLIN